VLLSHFRKIGVTLLYYSPCIFSVADTGHLTSNTNIQVIPATPLSVATLLFSVRFLPQVAALV